jgi:hypothetical protein
MKVSQNYTLPISMYYSTCDVTHCLLNHLLATSLFLWNFRTQLKSVYYSLLHLTTVCKRSLLSPTNLWHGPTENTSHGLCLLLCDVTAYMEVCTEPLPRNRLHNTAVLSLHACNAGCLSSHCLSMC